jgi:VWFA-related protein
MHHRRSLRTFAALLALVLTSCAPSKAQIQATHYATAATSPPLFQASRAIANKPGYFELNAFVANQLGRPIPDLKEADFLADTSGMRVPIAFFHENRSPMSIGILVDTSGSMKRKLDTVKLMLAEFINGLNPSDEVFLIAFSAEPQMLQPLTTNHQAVVQSLSQLHVFGQTSIYDSIVLAVGELGKGHQPSKAILLITDGIDNSSTVNEQDAITALKATGVRIYAIGIGDPNVSSHMPGIALGPFAFGGDLNRVDAKALHDMAHDAGGEAFIVPPMDKDAGQGFADAVKTISGMLSDSYTIGVVAPPGTYTSGLRLTIAGHPDAVVTTYVLNLPLT